MSESMKSRRVMQSRSGRRGKARWVVTVPRTKPLFSLERGTQKIHEPATIVSARIDHSLRLRSVEAKFDSSRAEAFCKTSNFLYYRVTLYAGDERGDSTLVEIVKEAGCGFSFTTEREVIMNAAKGLGGALQTGIGSRSLMIPPDLMVYDPPSDTEIEGSLDRAIDQIHSKHDSAVIFALQNLQSMTTQDKCNIETAERVSMYIIKNYNCVRDMIVSGFSNRVRIMKDERSEQICNISLLILMNGIQSLPLEKSSETSNTVVNHECEEYFITELVPSLLVGINNYRMKTHTAWLAMKCLWLLAKNSSLVRIHIGDIDDIDEIIQGAKLYGGVEHMELEKAASSMAGILQN